MKDTELIARKLIDCFNRGGKVIVIGNGGSAAMASHLVGELVGKFELKRKPLPAITLFDLATMTAIANDDSYENIFLRPLGALGKLGDILVVISTSGNSKNCLRSITQAKLMGLEAIDWPRSGESTAETQEIQLVEIHEVCRLIDKEFHEN